MLRPITSAIRNLKTIAEAELKEVLHVIWDSLPQQPIVYDTAVKEFSKRLKACVAADDGHFEHTQ